jgi:hypothetical protein
MNQRTIISLLALPLVVLLIMAAPRKAQAQYDYSTNGDGSIYIYSTNDDGSATIEGYEGPPWAICIPTNINSLLVSSIDDYAFYESPLTSVGIPDSITNIGVEVFAYCGSLTAINVDPANPSYASTNGVLFDHGEATLIQYPGGLAGNYAVPGTVLNIFDNAFLNAAFLGNVAISGSVTNIGMWAFADCWDMTNATIASGVADIGDWAFFDCTNLISIGIPNSVTNLGEHVFHDCTALTNVLISCKLADIEDFEFADCISLTNLTIPASVTNLDDYAFNGCTNLAGLFFNGNAPEADVSTFDAGEGNPATPTAYYLVGTSGWGEFSTNTDLTTVLWDPIILSNGASFGVVSNQFGFIITNGTTTNIPIVVESNTNLGNPVWVPLWNLILTNTFYFRQTFQPNSPSCYYRIIPP